MTPEMNARIVQLRTEGLSMKRIGAAVGISETSVFKQLHPKPKLPPQKAGRPAISKPSSPPTLYHSTSVPITRPLYNLDRQRPQLTHEQMRDDLRRAVINTSRLR
jgi:hypothetical protein